MQRQKKKKVVIIGAGPAGLSAGLELSKNGYIVEIIESKKQRRSKVIKNTYNLHGTN